MKVIVRLMVLMVVAGLVWAMPAPGDTVLLDGGGKIDGTIDSVVVSNDAGTKTLESGSFVGISLGTNTADTVTLKGGGTIQGRVVSIQVKSIGGALEFKREVLRSIEILPGITDAIRTQYQTKRAAVKDTDAAGLCQLADWCRKNNLNAEARELALLSLKVDANSNLADLAHLILGHERVDGKWQEPVAPTQPVLPTQLAQPATGAGGGSDAETVKKVKPELVSLLKKLVDEYKGKADAAAEQDQASVKKQYQKDWESLQSKLKTLQSSMDQLDDQIRRDRDDLAYERRVKTDHYSANRVQDLERSIRDANYRKDQKKDEYDKTQQASIALAAKIRSAKGSKSEQSKARSERVDLAKSKIERILLAGKEPSEADMRAIFEDALKDPK